jgi:hypothetical protein
MRGSGLGRRSHLQAQRGGLRGGGLRGRASAGKLDRELPCVLRCLRAAWPACCTTALRRAFGGRPLRQLFARRRLRAGAPAALGPAAAAWRRGSAARRDGGGGGDEPGPQLCRLGVALPQVCQCVRQLLLGSLRWVLRRRWPRQGRRWPRQGRRWPRQGRRWPRQGRRWPRQARRVPRPATCPPAAARHQLAEQSGGALLRCARPVSRKACSWAERGGEGRGKGGSGGVVSALQPPQGALAAAEGAWWASKPAAVCRLLSLLVEAAAARPLCMPRRQRPPYPAGGRARTPARGEVAVAGAWRRAAVRAGLPCCCPAVAVGRAARPGATAWPEPGAHHVGGPRGARHRLLRERLRRGRRPDRCRQRRREHRPIRQPGVLLRLGEAGRPVTGAAGGFVAARCRHRRARGPCRWGPIAPPSRARCLPCRLDWHRSDEMVLAPRAAAGLRLWQL